jgi:hypothetical protein
MRRVEDPDHSRARVHASVDAALPGEPQEALAVERGRVEVGVVRAREREGRDLQALRIDANDGVEAAIGDPRRPVRPDDDPVRCRPLTE